VPAKRKKRVGKNSFRRKKKGKFQVSHHPQQKDHGRIQRKVSLRDG